MVLGWEPGEEWVWGCAVSIPSGSFLEALAGSGTPVLLQGWCRLPDACLLWGHVGFRCPCWQQPWAFVQLLGILSPAADPEQVIPGRCTYPLGTRYKHSQGRMLRVSQGADTAESPGSAWLPALPLPSKTAKEMLPFRSSHSVLPTGMHLSSLRGAGMVSHLLPPRVCADLIQGSAPGSHRVNSPGQS